MTEKPSDDLKPEGDLSHAPENAETAGESESKPPRKSPLKGLLILAVLLSSLTAIYAMNPSARTYALNTIEALRERTDEFLNPPPERDLELLELAASHWQLRNWEKINESHTRLVELEPENFTAWSRLATARHQLEDYHGAIEANRNAAYRPGLASMSWYNMACEYALTDQIDEAFEAIDMAFRNGFFNNDLLKTDPEIDTLRDDERFFIPPAPQRLSFTTQSGATIEYWLVLPRDYDPENTYPGLIGIPGGGQTMTGGRGALNNFWGMQAYLHEWIVITPAAPSRSSYYIGDGHLILEDFLDEMLNQYNIEDDKFHIAGFSNGGTSAFNIASQFPEKFLSLTTFPGYAIPGSAFDRLENLKGIRISMYWGEKDLGPSEKLSLETHDRLKELGIDSLIKEFAGEPHIPTSLVGDKIMPLLDSYRESSAMSGP